MKTHPVQACRGGGTKITQERRGGVVVLQSESDTIRSLDQLLDKLKVNRAEWEPVTQVVNSWEGMRARRNADGFEKVTLYQIRATLRRRRDKAAVQRFVTDLVAQVRRAAPAVTRRAALKRAGYVHELAIMDPHFGKLSWAKETGYDFDLKLTARWYSLAVDALVARMAPFPVGRFLLSVGNDFYHVDGSDNATHNKTVVDVDSRWQKSFSAGRMAVVEKIRALARIAPVDVVMVPGNHDWERVYYLGDVLQAAFWRDSRVTIDNGPSPRKYWHRGRVLLGFTHGHEEKRAQLPLIMAGETGDRWAASAFREWRVGHLHYKSERLEPVSEERAVRIRQIPSLSPPDAWHHAKGLLNLRAAEGYVWDPQAGCVATVAFHADEIRRAL